MSWLFGLAFWGGTPLWVRKLGVYCAIGLLILWAGRLWLNKHDDKIFQQGRVAATAEMEKAKKAEWALEAKKLEKERAELMQQERNVTAARAELDAKAQEVARMRKVLEADLVRAMAAIRAGTEAGYAHADAIPAGELDREIRAQSAKLAGAR